MSEERSGFDRRDEEPVCWSDCDSSGSSSGFELACRRAFQFRLSLARALEGIRYGVRAVSPGIADRTR